MANRVKLIAWLPPPPRGPRRTRRWNVAVPPLDDPPLEPFVWFVSFLMGQCHKKKKENKKIKKTLFHLQSIRPYTCPYQSWQNKLQKKLPGKLFKARLRKRLVSKWQMCSKMYNYGMKLILNFKFTFTNRRHNSWISYFEGSIIQFPELSRFIKVNLTSPRSISLGTSTRPQLRFVLPPPRWRP